VKRATEQLSKEVYDLAIIGGGIYGAWVAWDAVLRGLTVALVDQGDFGNATSANSQKIVHGGLRYLQHVDLRRMRQSIRERSILMRVAPYLVHPMPVTVPTYGYRMRGKPVMSVALRLNDLISFDRNRHLAAEKTIPGGRLLSKAEVLQLCPGLDQNGLTGGALFYDAQVHNVSRLILSILQSASKAGAHLANYVKVIGFLRKGEKVNGFRAEDLLTKNRFKVHARTVVNCSGPWLGHSLDLLDKGKKAEKFNFFKAVILVTRPIVRDVAVGIPCTSSYRDDDAVLDKGYRYFFITPWRNTSLIGTYYVPFEGHPDDFQVTKEDIRNFLREFNQSYGGAHIGDDDIHFAYGGLLPRGDIGRDTNEIQYAKRYKIIDHEGESGIQGLLSILGVKYTTARDVAEKAVDLVLKKLAKGVRPCRTHVTPIWGGTVDPFNEFQTQQIENRPKDVSEDVIRHLISAHGSQYQEILRYREEDPCWNQHLADCFPVMKAEIIHGIRVEMAQKLSDFIFRRTELGTAGYPGHTCLDSCAAIMSDELGWDEERTSREIQDVRLVYARHGFNLASPVSQ